MSTRLAPSACLACGTTMDAATHTSDPDVRPSPNDITICLYCGHLMAFGDDLQLRALTDDEMHQCAGDPVILKLQKARAKVVKTQ